MIRRLLVITALLSPGMAQADGVYASIKGWDIDYASEDGYLRCSLSGLFEGDTFISVLLTGQGEDMQQSFVMSDDDWRSIRDGQTLEIGIRFDDLAPWTLSATGLALDEGGGFLASAPAYSESAGLFAKEFKYSDSMALEVDGREVDRFNLHGTAAAYEKMVECQGLLIEANASSDPFAASADPFAASSDPFAR